MEEQTGRPAAGLKLRNLLKVVVHIRKYGWEKTKEEWVKQYLLLETPESLMRKEIVGYVINLVGLLIIITYFVWSKRWVFLTATAGGFIIFYYQLKMKLRSYRQLKDLRRQAKELEEVLYAKEKQEWDSN